MDDWEQFFTEKSRRRARTERRRERLRLIEAAAAWAFVAAIVLGVLVGAAIDRDAYRLAGTALIGAFTTFSTWTYESHRLGEDGNPGLGVLNFAVSLIAGLGAAWAGRHIGGCL